MSHRNLRFMAASLLCLGAFTMAACSDEDTAPKNDTPWKINNSNSDMGSPQDMVLPRDQGDPGPVDLGPGPSDFGPIGVDIAPPPVDFGLPPADLGPPDMSLPPDMAPPSGCTRNSECARSEVCCLTGLSGESACTEKTQCLGGFFDGLCSDNSDCGAGEQCCDGGQIAQGRKICSDRGCGGMMMGQSCTTNSECSATNQLCCPGLSGGQCGDQCSFNGGLCTQDAECPGQKCCQFMVGGTSASVCLDRCR